MKLVCIVQMYNENSWLGHDGLTNLQRFIYSIRKYCDELIIYDDASKDDSIEEAFRTCTIPLTLIRGEANDFANELEHKRILLEKARERGADWVLWLDMDETIEAVGERGAVRVMCQETKADAINLFEVNLWRTHRYYRVDELWAQGLFCRLWRMTPDMKFNPSRGLHQRLYPDGIKSMSDGFLKVIHYGYATTDAILRKYALYKSHGQVGWPLFRMVNEQGIKLKECRPEWFGSSGWPCGPTIENIGKPLVGMV